MKTQIGSGRNMFLWSHYSYCPSSVWSGWNYGTTSCGNHLGGVNTWKGRQIKVVAVIVLSGHFQFTWCIFRTWGRSRSTVGTGCIRGGSSYCFMLWMMLWWCGWLQGRKPYDLFQPKTFTFSSRSLIWVHYKILNLFSQTNFSLFSHLNSVRHNLVI